MRTNNNTIIYTYCDTRKHVSVIVNVVNEVSELVPKRTDWFRVV